MKEAKKRGSARAIDARTTMIGMSADPAGRDPNRKRNRIGWPVAHATAHPAAIADTGADATTGKDARARIRAAGRPGKAAGTMGPAHDERAAPAALPALIHRPARLIQPHSLFCILLPGELPPDFPDRPVGESQV
ncbi:MULTISPECIES: hypothetical protein [Burkholderia]|uniref:hypothetical protein n=1 Tax=Burkholderia TaxID=32008 RepID=UPI00126A7A57|nr:MULTISPECIES: hypothetical protein [Burkholderia]